MFGSVVLSWVASKNRMFLSKVEVVFFEGSVVKGKVNTKRFELLSFLFNVELE